MKYLSKYLVFIIFSLFLIPNVLAVEIAWQVPPPIKSALAGILAIPDEWLADVPTFLYNFLIPFVAIMVVCLALIREIMPFPRSRNLPFILAFLMAFATLSPSEWVLGRSVFYMFVSGSLAWGGAFGYAIFIGLFFFGGAMFFWRRGARAYIGAKIQQVYAGEIGRLNAERANLESQRTGLVTRIANAAPGTDTTNLQNALSKIDDRILKIEQRIEDLQRLRRHV